MDDIEEELGFPRKWTDIEGIPYEERVKMLRHHFEKDVTIDYVFEKYLGTNRFGDKIIWISLLNPYIQQVFQQ